MKTVLLTMFITLQAYSTVPKKSILVMYHSEHYMNWNKDKFDIYSYCGYKKDFEHCSERVINYSISKNKKWDVCFIELGKIKSPNLVDFVMYNCREIQ